MAKKVFTKKTHSGIKYEEGLPLPFVKYEYGDWVIKFGDNKENFKVCGCFKKAIINLIESKRKKHNKFYGDGRWEKDFKEGAIGTLYCRWIKLLQENKFQDDICHRCNSKIPSIEYCHPMYGGKFKRTFGWYIKRKGGERFDFETLNKFNKYEERVNYINEF